MLLSALLLGCAAAVALWTAGAVFYDVCQGSRWGRALAAAWLSGVVALFTFWQPVWQPFLALLAATAVFLVWWFRQKPRHDRDWDPSVSVLPRAVADGDAVTVENVRNFDYGPGGAVTPRHETRRYHLANLVAADVIFFNWGVRWMSHPVVVFDFGPDGRVCVSIEVRYRKGQGFAFLRSLYRQQELIFLVGDERDVILRRTAGAEPQEALLYRLVATPAEVRTAFLDYAATINSIHDTPRWYHGLCANCTTSFYRLPHSRRRLDWRVLANGRLDEALYRDGRLDRSLPFPELKRAARLTEIANAAPADGFGDHIRRELEGRRHGR
jgi:hypothetical protein